MGTESKRERKKRMETDRERIKQETDYGAERLLGRERVTDKAETENRLTERQTDRDRRRQCIRSKDKEMKELREKRQQKGLESQIQREKRE